MTINAAVETTQARHPILSNGYGSIQIDGFSGLIPKKCFCIMADGHRYQEHGISTGSVLFCQRAAEINDGDLIVVKENGAFALYLYLKDRKVKADGKKRMLSRWNALGANAFTPLPATLSIVAIVRR